MNIPVYTYLWQLAYDLKESKFVSVGMVITLVGTFDNSAQNPYNPAPLIPIPWGEMSRDEMFFEEYVYKAANQQVTSFP